MLECDASEVSVYATLEEAREARRGGGAFGLWCLVSDSLLLLIVSEWHSLRGPQRRETKEI